MKAKRIYLFPEQELFDKLENKANSLGIPISHLCLDILKSIDLERTNINTPQSMHIQFQQLLDEVQRYVEENKNGKEFILRQLPNWSKINQASYTANGATTPNARRSSIGAQFINKVKKQEIPNIVLVTKIKNGKEVPKLRDNACLYRIVKEDYECIAKKD